MHKVRFAGRRNDVAQIMRASAVFALASRWEGMPNVLLEAGAAGLPIVATTAEGVSEIIESGLTGRLVEIGAIDELSSALSSALSERTESQRMATELQKRIAKDFSWESVVARYDALYASLLSNQSR
jgi:glycosyltransferase involved in cell wall biosynthesis